MVWAPSSGRTEGAAAQATANTPEMSAARGVREARRSEPLASADPLTQPPVTAQVP
jgi:hypothetical protein